MNERISALASRVRWNWSIANIGVAIFAVLGAWSASYTWTTIGATRRAAEHYRSEDIVFWSSTALLSAAIARGLGLMGCRTYGLAVVSSGFVSLGAVIWMLAFVVGDGSAYGRATLQDGPGLWMAVTAILLSLMLAMLHVSGDLGEWLRLSAATVRDRTMALCAVSMGAAVVMPWADGLFLTAAGLHYARGLVVLACALVLLVVTVEHVYGKLTDRAFKVSSGLTAGTSFIVLYWFMLDVIGSPDETFDGNLVFVTDASIQGAAGFYAALAASAAAVVASVGRRRSAPMFRPAPFDVGRHLQRG